MNEKIDTTNPEVWIKLIIDLYFAARRKRLHLPWMEFVEDYLRDSVDDDFVVRFRKKPSELARDRNRARHPDDP